MPFPAALGRFNRRVTNRVVRPLAGRLGSLANVVHTGRRSGTEYRTPVLAFATPDGFAVALTYGPGVDWVQNVLAAGGCGLEYRRALVPLAEPRLVGGAEATPHVPLVVHWFLRLLRVDEFLLLRRVVAKGCPSAGSDEILGHRAGRFANRPAPNRQARRGPLFLH